MLNVVYLSPKRYFPACQVAELPFISQNQDIFIELNLRGTWARGMRSTASLCGPYKLSELSQPVQP